MCVYGGEVSQHQQQQQTAALPYAAVCQRSSSSCHQQQGRGEQQVVEPMHGAWVHVGGLQVAQVVAHQEHMQAWQARFMGLCCRPFCVCVCCTCCCIAAAGGGGGAGGGGSACVSWAVSLHTRGREWHLHSCALSELYQASQCVSILRCSALCVGTSSCFTRRKQQPSPAEAAAAAWAGWANPPTETARVCMVTSRRGTGCHLNISKHSASISDSGSGWTSPCAKGMSGPSSYTKVGAVW